VIWSAYLIVILLFHFYFEALLRKFPSRACNIVAIKRFLNRLVFVRYGTYFVCLHLRQSHCWSRWCWYLLEVSHYNCSFCPVASRRHAYDLSWIDDEHRFCVWMCYRRSLWRQDHMTMILLNV
jgi:hypothetical protein